MGKILTDHVNVDPSRFMAFINRRRNLETQLAEIRGEMGALDKQAKDDGIDVKLAKGASKIAKLLETDARQQHNVSLAYLRIMKVPIGTQLSFLEDGPDISDMSADQRRSKWTDDGFGAGARGDGRETCPHDPESDAGVSWMDGWSRAQAAILDGIRQLDDGIPADNLPEDGSEEHVQFAEPMKAIGDVADKVASAAKRGRGRPPKAPAPAAKANRKPPAPPSFN